MKAIVLLTTVCWLAAISQAGIVISKEVSSGTSGTIMSDGYGFDIDVAAIIETGTYDSTLDTLGFSFLGGLDRTTSSLTFRASLYAVGGDNLPTGSALATQTGLFADLGSTADWTYGSFLYNSSDIAALTNVVLAANTKYAVVLNSDDSDDYFWANDQVDHTVSDGFSYIQAGNSVGGVWDSRVYEYGLVVGVTEAVPEPATFSLFAIAFGLTTLYRRCYRRWFDR